MTPDGTAPQQALRQALGALARLRKQTGFISAGILYARELDLIEAALASLGPRREPPPAPWHCDICNGTGGLHHQNCPALKAVGRAPLTEET